MPAWLADIEVLLSIIEEASLEGLHDFLVRLSLRKPLAKATQHFKSIRGFVRNHRYFDQAVTVRDDA